MWKMTDKWPTRISMKRINFKCQMWGVPSLCQSRWIMNTYTRAVGLFQKWTPTTLSCLVKVSFCVCCFAKMMQQRRRWEAAAAASLKVLFQKINGWLSSESLPYCQSTPVATVLCLCRQSKTGANLTFYNREFLWLYCLPHLSLTSCKSGQSHMAHFGTLVSQDCKVDLISFSYVKERWPAILIVTQLFLSPGGENQDFYLGQFSICQWVRPKPMELSWKNIGQIFHFQGTLSGFGRHFPKVIRSGAILSSLSLLSCRIEIPKWRVKSSNFQFMLLQYSRRLRFPICD